VEKWRKQFGDDNTRQLLEWNNRPPNTFARLNTLKTDAAKLADRWREENVTCDFVSRDWLGENVSFELISHPPLASLGSFRDGWFYLQDPSTLLAPALLDAQPGENILDLCAAPGGKATFIAQQMNNTGKLIAHDLGPDRLRLIRENCQRLGVTNADIVMPTTGIQQMLTSFDRILVDAPCSNTGVMRRRVDLRWRIQSAEIERLRATQLDLLNQAATKLKSGGVMVYSTCSLEPEENSEVVQQFLAANPSFKLETERQLLPFVDDVDGAYVARLKRSA
jgi:16S rRNA (cytosine967-C5)-methyltransferase